MDNMPHNDMSQDTDMIKSVLQKIIDEMDSMEADRIMPEHKKPKMLAAQVDVMAPKEEPMMDEQSEDSSELDPNVLKELMDKAGQADDSGSMPDDMTDLPPGIADVVRRKKGLK